MDPYKFVSTGFRGLDRVIDGLRLGDNVVWQVDSVEDYRRVVDPYVAQARADERRIIYVRFANHPPVLPDTTDVTVIELDPAEGFEHFATAVSHLVSREGARVFYVFDCLSDLLSHWHSDLMVMNFFRVTCPWLFDLDTVAYFAIIRNLHSFATIASIRHTSQVLFDLYLIDDQAYIHPLKVWERYSPTMYFPHRIAGDNAISITSSGASARLFASLNRGTEQPDLHPEFDEQGQVGPGEGLERGEGSARVAGAALLLGEPHRRPRLPQHLQEVGGGAGPVLLQGQLAEEPRDVLHGEGGVRGRADRVGHVNAPF